MFLASLGRGKGRLTSLTVNMYRHSNRTFCQFKMNPSQTPTFSKASKKVLSSMILTRLHAGLAGGPTSATSMSRKNPLRASQILSQLFRFVWPKDGAGIKIRVVIALSLLVGSKLLNVAVPFVFKEIVDFLNKNGKIKDFGSSTQDKLILGMIVLVIGYGAARAGASLLGELRSAIFARVAQSSVTNLATQVDVVDFGLVSKDLNEDDN